MRLVALLVLVGLGALSQAVAAPEPLTISPKSAADSSGVRTFGAMRFEPRLVVFETSDRFTCDGGVIVTPLRPFDATPDPSQIMVKSQDASVSTGLANIDPPPIIDPSFDYSFTVSADGRALDIVPISESEARTTPRQPFVDPEGVQAAVAALSFAAGQPASGCRIHISGRVIAPDDAARADLLKTFALTPYASLRSPIYSAIVPAGSDCYDGDTLHRRVQYFAAVDEISEAPGARSWVVLQYDISPDGAARNVRVAATSGRKELEARAVAAAQRNTFAPQAKHGCMARYYDKAGIVTSPPEPSVVKSDQPLCPGNAKLDFGTLEMYPLAFALRRIEGYALIQFDVAPWGALGEVKVLKSEPAQAFGQSAQNLMRQAKTATGQGLQGCIVPFRFKMPANDTPPPPN